MGLSNSNRLFAMPSLIMGAARALDLGATLDVYNESETPDMADSLAISSDWRQVGSDIENAMTEYERSK